MKKFRNTLITCGKKNMKSLCNILEGLLDGDLNVSSMMPIIRMFSTMNLKHKSTGEKDYSTEFSEADWSSDSKEIIDRYCKKTSLQYCTFGDWIILNTGQGRYFIYARIENYDQRGDRMVFWSPKRIFRTTFNNHIIFSRPKSMAYEGANTVYKIVDKDVIKMFDDAWKKYYGRR